MKCNDCGSYSDQRHKSFCKAQYKMNDEGDIALAHRYEPRTKHDPQARYCFNALVLGRSNLDRWLAASTVLATVDSLRQWQRDENAHAMIIAQKRRIEVRHAEEGQTVKGRQPCPCRAANFPHNEKRPKDAIVFVRYHDDHTVADHMARVRYARLEADPNYEP